jgi:hypothetical protein
MVRAMVIRISILLTICLLLVSCEQNDCKGPLIDTINFHDSTEKSGIKYYLYSRTTGFQEKVVFFELYNKKPLFDLCKHSSIKPIYSRAFEESNDQPYIKELIFQPEQPESLRIIYTKDVNEGFKNVYDVRFTQNKEEKQE